MKVKKYVLIDTEDILYVVKSPISNAIILDGVIPEGSYIELTDKEAKKLWNTKAKSE